MTPDPFGCEKCGAPCSDFLCLDCSPLAKCPICGDVAQLEHDAYGLAVCSRKCQQSAEWDAEEKRHEGPDERQFR